MRKTDPYIFVTYPDSIEYPHCNAEVWNDTFGTANSSGGIDTGVIIEMRLTLDQIRALPKNMKYDRSMVSKADIELSEYYSPRPNTVCHLRRHLPVNKTFAHCFVYSKEIEKLLNEYYPKK